MRRFFTPTWLGLHAIAIALIAVFLLAGWWQLQRATGGNMQSWAYTFEWPLFAVFVVVMWVRMVRDELSPPEDDEEETVAESPSQALAIIEIHEEEDEELAAYNRRLARLNDEARLRKVRH